MRQPTRLALSLAGAVLLLAGWACEFSVSLDPGVNQPATVDAIVAGTAQAERALTAAVEPEVVTATSEVDQPPAATATPEATPTASTTPQPSAQLTENSNCRSGPLLVYDLITTFLAGEEVEVVGRNAAGDYWYVLDPDNPARGCWLWGRYAQANAGAEQVPVFTPPPTPTPAYVWGGDWQIWVASDAGSMTLNEDESSVSGTLKDGSGNVTAAFNGNKGEGGRIINGIITSSGGTEFPFSWRMLDTMNQFSGGYLRQGANTQYCGARSGEPMPEPCLWP